MATTENLYTGNGSTVLYSFTFPYLKTTDVKITLDGTATTAYSLANATQVQFNTAPASGVAIRIFRETFSDELAASFYSGASIRADDLNNNFLQNIYVTQETEFDVNQANTTSNEAKTTANTALSTANTADTNASSAVTAANTANTNATAAQTAATNAANSASSAQTSATAAQTSATAAATDAAAAQTSAAAAVSTANSAETTANTASSTASTALSTANTASTNASAAVTTANTADTNATAAQTSASNAATDASNAQTAATNAQTSATAAAASAAVSGNVSGAFTATGTPATALTVDVPIDVANGVKLPTNANSYDQEGAIRYNTTLDKIEIRKGSGWSTAAGGASISSTPPSLATGGDVWYDHDNGRAYVYYNDGDSSQWVEMNPSWNGYVADNSVTSAKIVDGTIVNADVNASAAIAGTKISPDFGSQNVVTTGSVGVGTTAPSSPLTVNQSSGNVNFELHSSTSGRGTQTKTHNDHATFFHGLAGDTTGDYIYYTADAKNHVFSTSNSEALRIDSSGRLLVGTSTAPTDPNADDLVVSSSAHTGITVRSGSTSIGQIYFSDATSGDGEYRGIVRYHHNDDHMAFWTAATEKVRIGSSGNVSIGTTANTNKLRVHEGSDNANTFIVTGADESSEYLSLGINSGVPTVTAGGVTGTSSALAFRTADSGAEIERMRIDSSGRLLVGTSSSFDQHAKIQASTTGYEVFEGLQYGGNPHAAILRIGKSRGSIGNHGLVANNDQLGRISFMGNDGSSFKNAAYIFAAVDGTPGTNDMPTRLVFSTTANGASTPTERARISSAGYFMASHDISDSDHYNQNYHALTSGKSNAIVLAVENSSSDPFGIFIDFSDASPDNNSNYFIRCVDSTNDRISMYSDGDIDNHDNSYSGFSDVKLKQDIIDSGSQWDDIKDLRVRKFKFKSDVTTHGDDAKTLIGVVAQEAELVSPGLVVNRTDIDVDGNDLGTTTKSVRYSVLYMKAVKALQEAMERIETLETKVAQLEANN